ncbi:MAG: anhydro-N-acetylmuramic acid kinase [Bacteroidota bacterium]
MTISRLSRLASQDRRLVAGLMSGTSLDGVDAVLADIRGTGRGLEITIRAFVTVPYPQALVDALMANSSPESSDVRTISQLNVRLAHEYAVAVRRLTDEAGVPLSDVDLIGSHGQTIHHVPDAADCAGIRVTSTLQIGDPSVLANLLGIPVVGDFRVADMALGGQGAPLVPYFDYVYFSSESETRALLNLGGIANITVLPQSGRAEDVIAFDTGPANMLIDGLSLKFFGEAYDTGGKRALSGRIDDEFLADLLLSDPYLAQEPPKSTGREHYNEAYVRQVIGDGMARGLSETDILTTATSFTASSVYQAYARFIRARRTIDVLIVAGGGRHNSFLMQKLRDSFAPIPVVPSDDYGLPSDAKEALCFAVLAHETAGGAPTNLPSVTGASHHTLLGKICLPA